MHERLDELQGRLFDRWVGVMLRHRKAVLFGVFALTVGFAHIGRQLPLMTTLQDFLPAETEGLQSYLEARDRFGSDEVALLVVEADDHFTPRGIARLRRLSELLAAHPFVERVISPVTAQRIHPGGDDSALVIEPHFADGAAPDAIRATVLADPLLEGIGVSRDGRLVVVGAQVIPNRDDLAKVPEIKEAIEARLAAAGAAGAAQVRFARGGPGAGSRRMEVAKQGVGNELTELAVEAGYARAKVHPVGFPLVLAHLLADARRNMEVIFPLTIVAIALMLLLLLRRPLDAILPVVCVTPAVIWAVALGGLIFGRVSIITSVSPVMVLVVGVSDVVHLVTQFRHELARGASREDAIRAAFRQVGAACVLTSITTFIGFGSMVLLPLPPIQELGVFAGVGVVTAFTLSFVLTPVLLSYGPPPSVEQAKAVANDRLARGLIRTAAFVHRHPVAITAAGLLATVGTVLGTMDIKVENSLTRKLDPEHPVRLAVRAVEDGLGASAEVELLIDGGAPEALKDPDLLAGLRDLERWLEADPRVGRVLGITDLLAHLHGVLAPERAATAPLPDSREMIAQYLLLFEMSGGRDLDTWIDADRRHARMLLRVRDPTAEKLIELADDIERRGAATLPSGVRIEANGVGLLTARMGPRMFNATIQGLAGATVLIAVLIGLLFRSVRIGALSIIPNVLPVGLGFWAVWLLLPQVDADTLSFLPVCVGIAVDDTIHFLTRFGIERARGRDRATAAGVTVLEAGHGIVRTSLILMAGFAMLLLANYVPVQTFGLMVCVTLVGAVGLDLTLAPAMAQLGILDARPETPPDRAN